MAAATSLALELVAGGLIVWTPEYTVIGRGTASCGGRTVAVYSGDQLRLVRRVGPGKTATAVLVRQTTLYRISALDGARFTITVARACVVGGRYAPAELDSRGVYDLLPPAAGE
jgi:hypothetical protein